MGIKKGNSGKRMVGKEDKKYERWERKIRNMKGRKEDGGKGR